MAAFDLRDVEFASDGISDSLTLTMSPALFHENLKREISTAKRENRNLTILSISLPPDRFQTAAALQQSLIELAFELRSELRGGDFFARTSDVGFWVLLRTSQLQAQVIVERLSLARRKDMRTFVVAREHDEHKEWIERIDQINHFG